MMTKLRGATGWMDHCWHKWQPNLLIIFWAIIFNSLTMGEDSKQQQHMFYRSKLHMLYEWEKGCLYPKAQTKALIIVFLPCEFVSTLIAWCRITGGFETHKLHQQHLCDQNFSTDKKSVAHLMARKKLCERSSNISFVVRRVKTLYFKFHSPETCTAVVFYFLSLSRMSDIRSIFKFTDVSD